MARSCRRPMFLLSEWHVKMQEIEQTSNLSFLPSSHSSSTPRPPLLLDIRNMYEYEIGRFQAATPIHTSTFKETWKMLDDILQNETRDR
eukprot:766576-Hanusia_phi.AAC.3